MNRINRIAAERAVRYYEKACSDVVDAFLERYFDLEDPTEEEDYFWVGSKVGDMLTVGDHFFNMDNMVDALRLEVPVDTFFAWYDQWVNPSEKEPRYNLEHYNRLLPNENKKHD